MFSSKESVLYMRDIKRMHEMPGAVSEQVMLTSHNDVANKTRKRWDGALAPSHFLILALRGGRKDVQSEEKL